MTAASMELPVAIGACPQQEPRTTMRSIASEVAAKHGLTLDDLRSRSAKRRIAHPRQEAMWIMRQQRWLDGTQRYSLPQIGRFFDGRDHTTVLHGERRHGERLGQLDGGLANG